MNERILPRHPQGKAGVNIDRAKHETMRGAILEALRRRGDLTFGGLTEEVGWQLEGKSKGSISWYVTNEL